MNLLDQLKQKGIEVKQIPTCPVPNNADDMNTITIQWEGPFSLNEAIGSLNGRHDYGLYQIYGTHITAGPGQLLNIGKTDTPANFSTRLGQKKDEWIWYDLQRGWDVSIHIARVSDKFPNQFIDLAEALEIYWHSPPYNGQHIDSCPRQPLLQIINGGKRGKLEEGIHNNPPPWYRR